MIHWAWLILAASVGGFVGMFVMGLMTCCKRADEAASDAWKSSKNK